MGVNRPNRWDASRVHIQRMRGTWLAVLVAAAAMLAAAVPAVAQVSTVTTSTTAHTTNTSSTLPGTTVVAPGQPVLTSQLQPALAGPNGPALQSLLARLGVLGPVSAVTLVNTQTSTATSVTTTLSFGPGTILIGPNQSITFFVAPGTVNVNTNTHTETFVHDTFQASQSLSNQGINFLLGDLHASFQTTLLDGAFQFMDVLFARGAENGALNGPGSAPLGFAPESPVVTSFEDAYAFAAKAPRVPVTVAMTGGWQAWIRGSLAYARFDGTAANFGFKYRSASGEVGLERVVGPWMYGAAAGFGFAKVTQNVSSDSGDIDTIRAGAYASYRPGPWRITGAVAVGFSNIEATRLAALPVPARADYDATTISAGLEAARRIQTAFATVEPLAGFVYTALRVDSFRETGTTFLDLSGSRAHIDALKGYVGARAHKTYASPGGWAWTPEVRGRVLYDFLNDPRGFTARFIADPAGTPIAVTGLQPDRFAVMIGGAITARISPGWRAFASYDAELRGGDVTHLVSGGVKGNW